MKTEKAIRAHRDDLRKALKMPCNCAATGHKFECVRGGDMMKAVEQTLSWILDENPDADYMVENLSAGVRQP